MAKTETNVSTLKINRGTYAKVQENLSSITENELIITSDKNVPIPTTNDNGKAVVVNASGEYELGTIPDDVEVLDCTSGSLPTGITYNDVVTLMATKVVVAKWRQNTKIYEGIVFQAPQGYSGLRASVFVESFAGIGTYNTLSINENGTIQTRQNENYSYMSPNYNFQNINVNNSKLTSFMNNNTSYNFGAVSIYVTTTAPTADNTDGGTRIVKLTSEPATRYNGWWYIITSSSSSNSPLPYDAGGAN